MYVVTTTPRFQVGAHNGVPENRTFEVRHPIHFSCGRIDRNSRKIAGIHKVLKRLWTLLFVQGVVIDRVPYSPQVRSENSFTLSLTYSDTLSRNWSASPIVGDNPSGKHAAFSFDLHLCWGEPWVEGSGFA